MSPKYEETEEKKPRRARVKTKVRSGGWNSQQALVPLRLPKEACFLEGECCISRNLTFHYWTLMVWSKSTWMMWPCQRYTSTYAVALEAVSHLHGCMYEMGHNIVSKLINYHAHLFAKNVPSMKHLSVFMHMKSEARVSHFTTIKAYCCCTSHQISITQTTTTTHMPCQLMGRRQNQSEKDQSCPHPCTRLIWNWSGPIWSPIEGGGGGKKNLIFYSWSAQCHAVSHLPLQHPV